MPASARGVFAARLDLTTAYAERLATDGVTRGLIGPREASRIWDRHLLNCAVLTDLLPEGADVCDVGSGAGLPGLVLAIRRADLRVTLVEPLLRRTAFLAEVVQELGLDNVEVLRHRAEELHGRCEFGVVTSRAVAPLPRLLAWSKGATAADEVEQARDVLVSVGAGTVEVLTVGEDLINPPTTVIRAEATRLSRLGWDEAQGRRNPGGSARKQRKGRRT